MCPRPLRIVAVALALVVGACGASTKIEESWTSPNARNEQLQRVVTVYMSGEVTTRHVAEDKMAMELARKGVQATPSYAILADDELRDFKRASARLRSLGYDGIIVMRLVDKEHQINYMPGGFDSFWGPAWGYAYDPGYIYTTTVYRIETDAYSLRDNQLLWTAVSKTVDPRNTDKLITDVTKVAADQLAKRGIVGYVARR